MQSVNSSLSGCFFRKDAHKIIQLFLGATNHQKLLSMTENRFKCDDSECEIQSVGFENMEQIMVSKTFSGAVVVVW